MFPIVPIEVENPIAWDLIRIGKLSDIITKNIAVTIQTLNLHNMHNTI